LTGISVADYHGLIASGFFRGREVSYELLEGRVLEKVRKNPRHNSCQRRLARWLHANAPEACIVGVENSITFQNSELEPDGALIRGREEDFVESNPNGRDVELVVEVGDASLNRDQNWKSKVYAKSGIPHYWIVNIPEACVELYSQPEDERYARRSVLRGEQEAALTIAGVELRVRASDLLGRE
jgi:Uma2 family endonuclease